MPPKLALWGSLFFIAWVFRWDARKNPYPSATLWLPTLWIMRCGSRSIDFWIGGGENGRWDPILIAVMILCGIFALLRRPCHWGGVLRHNAALFCFYGYLVLSVFWADALEDPAIKVLRPLGDLIMALVVATEINPREAIATMFRRCAFLLIPLSIVLARYFHQLGRLQSKHWGGDMWIGVTTHKNPLGQLCLVSALAFLWFLYEEHRKGRSLIRQPVAWLYLGMTFYLFKGGSDPGSRSGTAITCLVVAVVVFIVVGLMRDHLHLFVRRTIMGVVVLIAVSGLLDLCGTSLQAVTAGIQGKDATLTDRTYLWQDVIRLGMEHPILGSGYGAFWVPSIFDKLSPEVNNSPEQAHNGYLETFADLGLVGVALLAWVIFSSLGSVAKMIGADFEYGRFRAVLLVTVMVMNYTEATFPRGTHLWWFGFLIVAVYARPWVFWPEAADEPVLDEDHHTADATQHEEVPA